MTNRPRPLVAGNWKMNGLRESLGEICLIRAAVEGGTAGRAEIVVCPPATLIMVARLICEGSAIALGGQHCHEAVSGPHTGDISAEMLKDAGASFVILGHSERRAGYREGNASVRAKTSSAIRAGLTAIVCVGETLAEREAGDAWEIVGAQLAGSIPPEANSDTLVIAYEPVWAIGTGRTPTLHDIEEMHGRIRRQINEQIAGPGNNLRILYGGSVKPANAHELLRLDNVDGALVGGASLRAGEFMGIASVYR